MHAVYRRRWIRVAVLCCAVAFGTLTAHAQESNKILVSGSRYMYFTVTDLARHYGDKNPNSNIIVSIADSDTGFRKFLAKEIHALMSFRKLDEDEKAEAEERGIRLGERMVGVGAVAVITQPENPVGELTVDQVRRIFLGELTDWSQVGGPKEPIVPMTRDESLSGTEAFFKELVLQGVSLAQSVVRVCKPDVVRAVWKQQGAIADARYSEAVRGKAKGMVKIIAIRQADGSPAVSPSEDTVKDRSYPICGPLYIYHDANAQNAPAREFVEFCSASGLWPAFAQAR